MKDIIIDEFQNSVDSCLLRHKSILDIMSKLQESQSRVSRAVIKSVTNCGCLSIEASKQCLNNDIENIDLENMENYLDSHVHGELCDKCREKIESELGNELFYIASLCNTLNISLYDIFLNEYKKMETFDKLTLR